MTNRINAGCYVFRREVIDRIPPGRRVSVERETFPELISAGDLVLGHVDTAYWLDVGTPEAFVCGSRDLVLGELASTALPGPCGQVLVLPGGVIEPGAQVGGGTVSGRAAASAPARRWTAACCSTARSSARARWSASSAVGRSARIGGGAVLDGVVIGDGARIASGNELAHGLRVWPEAEIGPAAIRFSAGV